MIFTINQGCSRGENLNCTASIIALTSNRVSTICGVVLTQRCCSNVESLNIQMPRIRKPAKDSNTQVTWMNLMVSITLFGINLTGFPTINIEAGTYPYVFKIYWFYSPDISVLLYSAFSGM